ncbi:MAG: AbrB/MazE/SpoVT family DNA-binding domain-containing protein [Gammaproteobacteria bacterium]|nr:AbrB/MazE/SpoVT family DNA-binding domain-containing protein [Gammaproteobacteria bacterium]
MNTLSTTKLSSKGQVVIPDEIRTQMGLHTGDQFIVVAEKDVLILKVISKPRIKNFTVLIDKAHKAAHEAGLTKTALADAIDEARKK